MLPSTRETVSAISASVSTYSPTGFGDYLFDKHVRQISGVRGELFRSNIADLGEERARAQAEKATIRITAEVIGWILQRLNLHNTMNALQIAECAKAINRDYYFLSYADLKYFASRFISGEFGEIKVSIDQSVIMRALGKFDRERDMVIQARRQAQHEDALKKSNVGYLDPLPDPKKPKEKRKPIPASVTRSLKKLKDKWAQIDNVKPAMYPKVAEAREKYLQSVAYLMENDPDFAKKYKEKIDNQNTEE